jgi:hypothetical protein
MKSFLTFVLCLGLLSGTAFADSQLKPASTKQDFIDQADAIRQEMNPGGRYEFVTATEKQIIGEILDEIAKIMDKHKSANGLNERELATILNDQEQANAILTRRDGERLVCANEARTGTHITTVNCQRYAELQAAHRATEQYMRSGVMGATQCGGDSLGHCPGESGGVSFKGGGR